jgi:hypothetical protein
MSASNTLFITQDMLPARLAQSIILATPSGHPQRRTAGSRTHHPILPALLDHSGPPMALPSHTVSRAVGAPPHSLRLSPAGSKARREGSPPVVWRPARGEPAGGQTGRDPSRAARHDSRTPPPPTALLVRAPDDSDSPDSSRRRAPPRAPGPPRAQGRGGGGGRPARGAAEQGGPARAACMGPGSGPSPFAPLCQDGILTRSPSSLKCSACGAAYLRCESAAGDGPASRPASA